MRKIGLSALALMTTITCSSAENALNSEAFEIPTTEREKFDAKLVSTPNVASFRKYVSINVLHLAALQASFNFGFRKEIGHNGCDLGIYGSTGKLSSAFGGYASYLYYFNPDSNFNFYSGVGIDSGLLWNKYTYGANARCVVPLGLNHFAKSGRREFFQISIIGPYIAYQKLYKSKEADYYLITSGYLRERDWDPDYPYDNRKNSAVKRNFKKIGITLNYGIFF